MPGPSTFKDRMRAMLCGASTVGGPALRPLPQTLARPEGTRRYLLAAPTDGAAGGRALVIVLHGGGASAEQAMGLAFPPSPLSLLLEIAARERFVVAAPDAGRGGWSDCLASEARVARKNDVAFIDALIDRAIAEHGVDPLRVYVVGVSRGGLMTYRLAAELSHRLAAFAVLLACMPPAGRARLPATPLPALIAGATADPFMPYEGGKFWYTLNTLGPLSGIEASAAMWRALAGLPDTPTIVDIPARDPACRTRLRRSVWGSDPAGMQVVLYRIAQGGHAEPSALKRYPGFINGVVGAQNGDIEIAEAAWDFFRLKRAARPGAAAAA